MLASRNQEGRTKSTEEQAKLHNPSSLTSIAQANDSQSRSSMPPSVQQNMQQSSYKLAMNSVSQSGTNAG